MMCECDSCVFDEYVYSRTYDLLAAVVGGSRGSTVVLVLGPDQCFVAMLLFFCFIFRL